MSGHSKWSQIRRAKGTADAKRGVVFSKLASAITIVARHGQDPQTNFQLRLAIDKAHSANMPKENIERAISRAGTSGGTNALEEIVFEIYGPSGTAFLVEAASDNRNRTAAAVRALGNKFQAKLAASGAVEYLFIRRGMITLTAEPTKREEVELLAIEAGAEDIEDVDDQIFIYTKPRDLESVRRRLLEKDFPIEDFSLIKEPLNPIMISDPSLAERLIKFAEALEELPDVVKVESNFEIPQELLKSS